MMRLLLQLLVVLRCMRGILMFTFDDDSFVVVAFFP
jgi:hypothetical protein